MSATFPIPATDPLLPVGLGPVFAIGKAIISVVARVRAAFRRRVTPSFAGRHGLDVDILSTSHWNGYGRNGVTWDGIGYRI